MGSRAIRNVTAIKTPYRKNKYSIIIPVAGLGSRMKSFGPKALLSLKNTNIINRQLHLINTVFKGNYEIILVSGFCSDKVMNKTPSYLIHIENEHYETTNVLRSIGMGLRASTTDKVIIIYGDLVFNAEALNFGLYSQKSIAVIDYRGNIGEQEVGCVINNNIVENVMYGLPNKWAQILMLQNEELDMMKTLAWNRENNNMFGFEAINQIIDWGGVIHAAFPPGIKVIDVDTSKDLCEARKIK